MTRMPETAQTPLRWALDACVISGGLLFAYGWCAFDRRAAESVTLELHHDNATITHLATTAGLERSDVSSHYPDLPGNTGFLVYAAIGPHPPRAARLHLTFPNEARPVFVDLPRTLLVQTDAKNPDRLATWRRLAAKAWLHLRQGNFSFLREHAARLLPRLLTHQETPGDLERLLASLPEGMSLILDHDLGGGANIFRDRLITRLSNEGQTIALLVFVPAMLSYHLKIFHSSQEKKLPPVECRVSRDWWVTLAASRKFSTIYFNNCVSHPEPERTPAILLHFKRAAGARLVIFLHDFHVICPSHFLLNDHGRYCDLPDTSVCQTCLPRMKDNLAGLFAARNILTWREAWHPCLEAADERVCFARSGQELLQRAYPSLANHKITLRPHEVPPIAPRYRPPVPGAPLTIAIVGMINHHKGSQIALDLAEEIERRALSARLCIVGTLNASTHSKTIFQTGRYQPQDLPDILSAHQAQLALMPSIWPETFSFVTHELMATGIPILSFDLGAQGDAVRAYPRGRVVPMKSAALLLDDILAFRAEIERHSDRLSA